MPDVDWKKLKTEYITTDTSYRKLCGKYGVSRTALYSRAKKEKWVEAKKRSKDKIESKMIAKAEEKATDYRSVLYELAYTVAQNIVDFTKDRSLEEMMAIGLKPRDITGAIKDLEDALHIKSVADIEEQKARIDKLRKDAETTYEESGGGIMMIPAVIEITPPNEEGSSNV